MFRNFILILILGIHSIVIVKSARPILINARDEKPINNNRLLDILSEFSPGNVASNLFKVLIEKFRLLMPRGIPKYRIPVLEPFKIKKTDIGIDNKEVGKIRVDLKNLKVDYLSNFIIDEINCSWMGPTITVNIRLPEINIHGHYNLSGTLDTNIPDPSIFGSHIPLKGSGPFRVQIFGLKVYVQIVPGYIKDHLFLQNLDFDFSLESIEPALENLMGQGPIVKIMNQVVKEVIPQMIVTLKPEMLPGLKLNIKDQINKFLQGWTLQNICNFIGDLVAFR